MKTLQNLFGTTQENKSMNTFFNALTTDAMLLIKGGEEDPDEDLWPPKAGEGED